VAIGFNCLSSKSRIANNIRRKGTNSRMLPDRFDEGATFSNF
jgi:hypothetical protein